MWQEIKDSFLKVYDHLINTLKTKNMIAICWLVNTQTRLSAFTLSDAEFDLEVDGRGHHRLSEDQDVLQADHHHEVRKDLTAERKEREKINNLETETDKNQTIR